MALSFLQIAWWTIISLVGALHFFLLFSFGAQSMLLQRMTETERRMVVHRASHDYEYLWTVMLAYQMLSCIILSAFSVLTEAWVALDLVFLLPIVLFWLRKHINDAVMRKVVDVLLTICGILGPFLLGCYTSCYFFGNAFTIGDMADIEGTFEWVEVSGPSIFGDWRVVVFGLMIMALSRMQANLWLLWKIREPEMRLWNRRQLCFNASLFVILFVVAMYAILAANGYQIIGENKFEVVANKFLYNYLDLPAALACLLLGMTMICVGIWLGVSPLYSGKPHGGERAAIFHSFMGTILLVTSFFIVVGFNETPFFPSSVDMNSSMTIYNSSASEDVLKNATYVLATIIVFVSGSAALIRWGIKKIK